MHRRWQIVSPRTYCLAGRVTDRDPVPAIESLSRASEALLRPIWDSMRGFREHPAMRHAYSED